MNKLLEVREFDKISCKKEYEPDYKYLPQPAFDDLIEFIHSFTGDEEYSDALEFLKVGYRRNVGDYVSVNNYVGLIQMGIRFRCFQRLISDMIWTVKMSSRRGFSSVCSAA